MLGFARVTLPWSVMIKFWKELKSKRIYAALDVFSKEPYNGILNSIKDNLIKTPHIASSCINFYDGLANDFKEFYKNLNESY